MAINLDAASSATETVQDYTGGGGFLWNTGIHNVMITQCYAQTAKSGATALHFRFKNENGKAYKEDLYFISKSGDITYPVKDKSGNPTGKTRHIPGFATCANIVAAAFSDSFKEYIANEENGTSLNERYENFFKAACASCEPGIVPVWDWDYKKDIDTEVEDVMKNIIGKTINLAIIKKQVNKRQKNDKGAYVPVADSQEENEINNAFSLEKFSAAEMLAQAEEPKVYDSWLEANEGKVIDKRTIKDASAASESGSPAPQTANMFA